MLRAAGREALAAFLKEEGFATPPSETNFVFVPMASGERWREERTGLHGREFIETRRHWFSGMVPHDTGGMVCGGVNVLNLVEGEEVLVESPDAAFDPFVVHYAETFIVPATVGRYTLRPAGGERDGEMATIKAFVRTGI